MLIFVFVKIIYEHIKSVNHICHKFICQRNGILIPFYILLTNIKLELISLFKTYNDFLPLYIACNSTSNIQTSSLKTGNIFFKYLKKIIKVPLIFNSYSGNDDLYPIAITQPKRNKCMNGIQKDLRRQT